MPGAVVDVPVALGATVETGDPIVVVEAMKMEHTLRAPAAGVVKTIRTSTGSQVRLDEELVEVDLAGVGDEAIEATSRQEEAP